MKATYAVQIAPSAHMVHLLALRPELRDVFALADQVDLAVRWSA